MAPLLADATVKLERVTVFPLPTFLLLKAADPALKTTVSPVFAPATPISAFATVAVAVPSYVFVVADLKSGVTVAVSE